MATMVQASAKDRASALAESNAYAKSLGLPTQTASQASAKQQAAQRSLSGGGSSSSSTPIYDSSTGRLTDYGKSIGATPMDAGKPLPAEQLGTQPKYELPVPKNEPKSTFDSILTSALGVTQGTQLADTGKQEDNLLQQYLSSIKEPASLADINAKLEKDNKLKQKQEAVNTYQAQLNTIVNKSQADQLAVTGQGRGIPEVIIGGQQAKIAKEAAIQALPIQALLSAAQDDLATATAHVDKLFSIYAQDAENSVKFYNDQVKMVFDYATEKERQQLAIQQDDKKFQQSILMSKLDAQQKYAQSALESGNISAFNAITSLQPPTDVNSTTYQEDLASYDQRLNQAASKLAVGAGVVGGVDLNTLAFANQYASTGTIPPGIPKGQFGVVAQVAKELPKQPGTIVDANTGVKSSSVGATIQDDFTRLYNITQNVKKLKELDDARIGGVISGVVGKVTGSQAQSEYLAVRKAIVDDLSRMQSGAALTEAEVQFYEDYLPGRFSESFFLGQDSAKKIENFEKIMNDRLQNNSVANGLSIYGFSKVKVGDGEFTVGDIISNGQYSGRVNPDGSITIINQ